MLNCVQIYSIDHLTEFKLLVAYNLYSRNKIFCFEQAVYSFVLILVFLNSTESKCFIIVGTFKLSLRF